MVSVGAHAKADYFGINLGTTAARGLHFLEHQAGSAVAQHEAVPLLVPRAACRRGIVIALGQCPRRAESTKAEWRNAVLCATSQHDVRVAMGDQPGRHANAVGGRGAGAHQRDIGATVAMLDGDMAGDHVDDGARHEEWRDLARPALLQSRVIGLDRTDAADA